MTDDASVHPDTREPGPSSSATGEEGRTGAFTILLPLDGSERAARAIPIAEDLCRRLGGEIALIRVLPLTPLPFSLSPDYLPPEIYQQIVNDQERLAREYLEHVAAELRQRGMRVRLYTENGDPSAAILDAIPALGVAMVVMTTHGRTGLARFALGSVADRVVRGGGVPVLLVRSFPLAERPAEPRSALVPLDGSPLAESALFTSALQLAGPVLREITLTRVVDPRAGPEGRREAEAYLDQTRLRFVERLGGRECAISTRVEVGAPAARILASAHERASDLIIMSTRGAGGVGRLALGSVTDSLLRDGDMPILLACPPKGAPERRD